MSSEAAGAQEARGADSGHRGLLRPGDTCWRRAHAERVAFLVDGEACFGAVADLIERAEQDIWLVGWDFHSEVELRRPREDAGGATGGASRGTARTGARSSGGDGPTELIALLEARVRARPELQVHVLAWDFAMLYAFEREFLPLLQFGARTHARIHFAMDSAHPVAASQHQKLVVVDDAVALAGGFDLTTHRWDTREHRAEEPRRRTPSGRSYQPFHDVQIAVDGQAAAALGELARERWLRATGQQLEASEARSDPWPPGLAVAARDLELGIARTRPAYRGSEEVREVEALYRESIAAARHCIYIENQYLTATRIIEWLAERLREAEGPELVVVGPRRNAGWLEESTMGTLRDHAIRVLGEADDHGRLRVLYPHRADLAEIQMINVHAKLMIVDDRFLRIGSSNLSNRSLGLDAELDLAFESGERPDLREAIAGLRNDLLGEHLGVDADRVAAAIDEHGSLVAAVDALAGGDRSLWPIELDAADWSDDAIEYVGTLDPEHPAPLEEVVALFDDEAAPRPSGPLQSPLRSAAWSLLALALTAVWMTSPLAGWIPPERVAAPWIGLTGEGSGLLQAGALFVAAGLLFVPAWCLTLALCFALGPWLGLAVAWPAHVLTALLGHAAGRWLWRDAVRSIAGDRLSTLTRRMRKLGTVSTAMLRIVPVAPFTTVSLVAGASRLPLPAFLAGTALGTLPVCTALALAAGLATNAARELQGARWLWALLLVSMGLGVLDTLRRLRLRRRS